MMFGSGCRVSCRREIAVASCCGVQVRADELPRFLGTMYITPALHLKILLVLCTPDQ
jgi:hypothetical protein